MTKLIALLLVLAAGGGATWYFGFHNGKNEVKYRTAKAQEIQARYDYEISIAAIERSIGGTRKP